VAVNRARRNCMACTIGQAVRHCLHVHVRHVAGKMALEQVSPEISSLSPANQQSTTAPNLCVNRYATCLTRQDIITSSVFMFKALSPAEPLASHKEKSVLWWYAWAGKVVAYLRHYPSIRLNSPSLLLQLPWIRMPSARPDGQLMKSSGIVQQGRYL
jgi:hypothetical protein